MQAKGIASDYRCPDWYGHIQVAKYLGVDPDRLLHMPVFWKDKAMIAMTAEHEVQEILNQHPN